MKRMALTLAAFALTGALAFAQDAATPAPPLTIGGYLDVGNLTTIGADTGAKTIIKGDDSGIAGGSYEFRGAYSLSNQAGLIFNVRFENLASGTSVVYDTQSAYLWFLAPGLESLKVLAGNYNNDGTAWNAVDDNGAKATKGTGVALQFTPMTGFSLGGGVAPSTDGYTPPTYSAGATYTIADTALLQGALWTANKAWVATVDGAYAGGKLLLAGPFSAKGDFNIGGLSQSGSVVNTFTDVTLGYAVTDALSLGLLTYVYTYGSDIKDFASSTTGDAATLGLKINPSVSYTVNPVVAVSLGGTYFTGPNVFGVSDGVAKTYSSLGISTVPAANQVLNKVNKIEVNPGVTFTVDKNTVVYVNYLYDTVSGDDIDALAKVSTLTDKSWSTFKIDYRYTF